MLRGMGASFSVRIRVRSYELDVNAHVNHAVYHQYGEHARAEHLAAAGCSFERLARDGMGFVMLETHVRFLRELRAGQEVDVDSRLGFGAGRTFTIEHTIRGTDGVVASELSGRFGLIDATTRRLVADPAAALRTLASDPALLGL